MIIHGAPFTDGSYGWTTFNHKKRDVLKRYLKRLGAECKYSDPDNSRRSYSYRLNGTDYARVFFNEHFACWELHLYNERLYKRVVREHRKPWRDLCKP